jgi:predicted MFS family arabinose efflux permease
MEPRRLTQPILLAGTFMGFLDVFLVIVAVPSIAAGLHSSVADTQLVLSMYVVTYGASLVVGGRLGDRYGRRTVFAAGMAAFTLFSAGCAVAPSLPVLVALRALQGVGAAAMLPQVLATIQAVYDGEDRRRAVLAYTTALGAAAALGQVIGGGLLALDVAGIGWRALFAVNVPIGIAVLALIPRALPQTRAEEPAPIDVRGALVLAAALAPALLGLGIGPANGWPPVSWVLIAVGLALAALLPAVERRAPTPLLPGSLLRQRSVQLGLLATLGFYAANNATFLGFTLFLQDGLGIGALGAGAAYLPLGLAYMASTLAVRHPRAPSGPFAILVGSAAMVAGLAAAVGVHALGAGPVPIAFVLAVVGVGLGLVYPAIVASVLARVRPGEEGAATGVLLTATQMSNALGIAIVTAAWDATGSLAVAFAIAAALVLGVAAAGASLSAGGAAADGSAEERSSRKTPTGVPVCAGRNG